MRAFVRRELATGSARCNAETGHYWNARAVSNHEVRIDGEIVRKRYLRTGRAEPVREWSALVLLNTHAPGLAPRPLACETNPQTVVMSRVAGAPLDTVLTPELTLKMVDSYRTLYAVPVQPNIPVRYVDPGAFVRNNIEWIEEERTRTDVRGVVRKALTASREWHADAPSGIKEIRDPVLAQGDANVDNMLWDGSRVRLIDFEGFGVGDLAFEVADLVEHVSSRLHGLRDPQAVIAGFDLRPPQSLRVEQYRVVLATFWLLMVLPGNPGHGRNPESSDEIQAAHLLNLLSRQRPPRT